MVKHPIRSILTRKCLNRQMPLQGNGYMGFLNKAITQGLPADWQKNLMKALIKKGDANQPTDYEILYVKTFGEHFRESHKLMGGDKWQKS